MLLQGRLVRHAARSLPRALVVSGVRQGLPSLLPPLRHRCLGEVVFQLAACTVQALRERPRELLGDPLSAGAQAAPGYGRWRVLRTASHGTLWFSGRRQCPAWLVVVPDQGVAVYLWRQRGAVGWRHDCA